MPEAAPMSAPSADAPEMEGGNYTVPAPEDGYPKRVITDLRDGLQAAMTAIAKATHQPAGEVPEVPDEAFTKGRFLTPIPPSIVKAICDILKTAAMIGGKVEGRYDGDCAQMLATEEGAKKVVIMLELAAKDKVLLQKIADAWRAKAMAAPKGEAGEEAAESPAVQASEDESKEPEHKASAMDYM
jgi:hypothetical protein